MLPAARVRGTCCCFVPCFASSMLHFAHISHSRIAFMLRVLASHSSLSCVHFLALALSRACELSSLRFVALALCVAYLHVALAPLISHAAFVMCVRMLHLQFAFARCTLELRVCASRLRCAPARRACIPHLVRCWCALYVVRSGAFSPVAFALRASRSDSACCARVSRGTPVFNISPLLVVRAGCELPPSTFTPLLGKTASRRLDLTRWSSFFFAKKRKSRCMLRLDKRGVWSGGDRKSG